jgi:hypothetical protein
VTSFSDPEVEIPWSLHHTSPYTGKGTIVDMAKALKWIEERMQDELGSEAGRLFFEYDLEPGQVADQAAYDALLLESALESMPWIEIPLGAGEALPRDSFEAYEVTEYVEVPTTTKVIDWTTQTLVEVTVNRQSAEPVPTGEIRYRLRDGYRFEDGRLYRRPELADVMQLSGNKRSGKSAERTLLRMGLPQWIQDRMPQQP